MRAVLVECDVWIYGDDGFTVMGTGQNSAGVFSYVWCHILGGHCWMKEI